MAGFFKRLGVAAEEVEQILESSASARGVLVGYLAERKLVEMYFRDLNPEKPDDHDRSSKGDRVILYKGTRIRIESKSLQTNSVRRTQTGWAGNYQCDASDSRVILLPTGEKLRTTCLVFGGFDLLAINLFEFGQEWRFAFIHNNDLPQSPSTKYTAEQRKHLIQTTPRITWPLAAPHESEPWALLDRIVREKASRRR